MFASTTLDLQLPPTIITETPTAAPSVAPSPVLSQAGQVLWASLAASHQQSNSKLSPSYNSSQQSNYNQSQVALIGIVLGCTLAILTLLIVIYCRFCVQIKLSQICDSSRLINLLYTSIGHFTSVSATSAYGKERPAAQQQRQQQQQQQQQQQYNSNGRQHNNCAQQQTATASSDAAATSVIRRPMAVFLAGYASPLNGLIAAATTSLAAATKNNSSALGKPKATTDCKAVNKLMEVQVDCCQLAADADERRTSLDVTDDLCHNSSDEHLSLIGADAANNSSSINSSGNNHSNHSNHSNNSGPFKLCDVDVLWQRRQGAGSHCRAPAATAEQEQEQLSDCPPSTIAGPKESSGYRELANWQSRRQLAQQPIGSLCHQERPFGGLNLARRRSEMTACVQCSLKCGPLGPYFINDDQQQQQQSSSSSILQARRHNALNNHHNHHALDSEADIIEDHKHQHALFDHLSGTGIMMDDADEAGSLSKCFSYVHRHQQLSPVRDSYHIGSATMSSAHQHVHSSSSQSSCDEFAVSPASVQPHRASTSANSDSKQQQAASNQPHQLFNTTSAPFNNYNNNNNNNGNNYKHCHTADSAGFATMRRDSNSSQSGAQSRRNSSHCNGSSSSAMDSGLALNSTATNSSGQSLSLAMSAHSAFRASTQLASQPHYSADNSNAASMTHNVSADMTHNNMTTVMTGAAAAAAATTTLPLHNQHHLLTYRRPSCPSTSQYHPQHPVHSCGLIDHHHLHHHIDNYQRICSAASFQQQAEQQGYNYNHYCYDHHHLTMSSCQPQQPVSSQQTRSSEHANNEHANNEQQQFDNRAAANTQTMAMARSQLNSLQSSGLVADYDYHGEYYESGDDDLGLDLTTGQATGNSNNSVMSLHDQQQMQHLTGQEEEPTRQSLSSAYMQLEQQQQQHMQLKTDCTHTISNNNNMISDCVMQSSLQQRANTGEQVTGDDDKTSTTATTTTTQQQQQRMLLYCDDNTLDNTTLDNSLDGGTKQRPQESVIMNPNVAATALDCRITMDSMMYANERRREQANGYAKQAARMLSYTHSLVLRNNNNTAINDNNNNKLRKYSLPIMKTTRQNITMKHNNNKNDRHSLDLINNDKQLENSGKQYQPTATTTQLAQSRQLLDQFASTNYNPPSVTCCMSYGPDGRDQAKTDWTRDQTNKWPLVNTLASKQLITERVGDDWPLGAASANTKQALMRRRNSHGIVRQSSFWMDDSQCSETSDCVLLHANNATKTTATTMDTTGNNMATDNDDDGISFNNDDDHDSDAGDPGLDAPLTDQDARHTARQSTTGSYSADTGPSRNAGQPQNAGLQQQQETMLQVIRMRSKSNSVSSHERSLAYSAIHNCATRSASAASGSLLRRTSSPLGAPPTGHGLGGGGSHRPPSCNSSSGSNNDIDGASLRRRLAAHTDRKAEASRNFDWIANVGHQLQKARHEPPSGGDAPLHRSSAMSSISCASVGGAGDGGGGGGGASSSGSSASSSTTNSSDNSRAGSRIGSSSQQQQYQQRRNSRLVRQDYDRFEREFQRSAATANSTWTGGGAPPAPASEHIDAAAARDPSSQLESSSVVSSGPGNWTAQQRGDESPLTGRRHKHLVYNSTTSGESYADRLADLSGPPGRTGRSSADMALAASLKSALSRHLPGGADQHYTNQRFSISSSSTELNHASSMGGAIHKSQQQQIRRRKRRARRQRQLADSKSSQESSGKQASCSHKAHLPDADADAEDDDDQEQLIRSGANSVFGSIPSRPGSRLDSDAHESELEAREMRAERPIADMNSASLERQCRELWKLRAALYEDAPVDTWSNYHQRLSRRYDSGYKSLETPVTQNNSLDGPFVSGAIGQQQAAGAAALSANHLANNTRQVPTTPTSTAGAGHTTPATSITQQQPMTTKSSSELATGCHQYQQYQSQLASRHIQQSSQRRYSFCYRRHQRAGAGYAQNPSSVSGNDLQQYRRHTAAFDGQSMLGSRTSSTQQHSSLVSSASNPRAGNLSAAGDGPSPEANRQPDRQQQSPPAQQQQPPPPPPPPHPHHQQTSANASVANGYASEQRPQKPPNDEPANDE